ncbi:nucleotidyltransferase family protein [Lysinibacillus sphaericus]|uniref:nucleotidyltransferase family protein n=1 Tax=Lysinibacillus sphaericus TaxID=1421 RepID=UPI0019101B1F|nr:nucleotidyltransferase family protein [Lysinibacillus sphaericus]QPA52712.1 nucleotidyltransferase family protein [Lysinibacillus sphaericus]
MEISLLSNEENLVILLSKPRLSNEENFKLVKLLQSYLNWDKVIGMLEIHRVSGIAWENLQKYFFVNEDNKCTFPRLYKYLHNNFKVQSIRAKEQFVYTSQICELFDKSGIKYVLLKGIAISNGIYNDLGLRDFNDNDILVHPNDLNKVIQLLREHLGYEQGETKHYTKVKKQTRKEQLIRSMTSHEVVPFIKNVSNECLFLRQHIIDLHFSVNLMTKDRNVEIVEHWLNERIPLNINGQVVYTLKWENMLLFLCEHFYKEAVSITDIKMYKDLLLYKYCDILFLIEYKKLDWKEIVSKGKEFNLIKQMYFTLTFVSEISDIKLLIDSLNIEPLHTDYLNHVYYYDSNRTAYKYSTSSKERLFDILKPTKL